MVGKFHQFTSVMPLNHLTHQSKAHFENQNATTTHAQDNTRDVTGELDNGRNLLDHILQVYNQLCGPANQKLTGLKHVHPRQILCYSTYTPLRMTCHLKWSQSPLHKSKVILYFICLVHTWELKKQINLYISNIKPTLKSKACLWNIMPVSATTSTL